MNPSLFLADVDGTLIRTGTPLLPAVKDAARRFQNAGGLLTLCTGRTHLSTRAIAKELGIAVPCVLLGGAMLYDFSTETAVHATAIPGDARALARRLAAFSPDMSVQAYTAKRVHLLQVNEVARTRGIREELEPDLSRVDDIEGDIIKLVMTHDDPEVLRRCAGACFDDRHDFAFSSTRFAEVVAKGADKGAGALLLAARLGVPPSRLLAAGDAMTDLAAFAVAARSYAPENASDQVRSRCDLVVPSCDQAGMAVAFDDALRF